MDGLPGSITKILIIFFRDMSFIYPTANVGRGGRGCAVREAEWPRVKAA